MYRWEFDRPQSLAVAVYGPPVLDDVEVMLCSDRRRGTRVHTGESRGAASRERRTLPSAPGFSGLQRRSNLQRTVL